MQKDKENKIECLYSIRGKKASELSVFMENYNDVLQEIEAHSHYIDHLECLIRSTKDKEQIKKHKFAKKVLTELIEMLKDNEEELEWLIPESKELLEAIDEKIERLENDR